MGWGGSLDLEGPGGAGGGDTAGTQGTRSARWRAEVTIQR